jgi:hypothetical protein
MSESHDEKVANYIKGTQGISVISKKIITTLIPDKVKDIIIDHFSQLQNFDSVDLLQIVPLSNIIKKKDRKLSGGIVYKVQKEMLALPILNIPDLCSGISVYLVQPNKKTSGKEEEGIVLEELRRGLIDLKYKHNRTFEDFSIHRNQNIKEYVSTIGLGKHNCSITLEKVKDSETLKGNWSQIGSIKLMLIIRSYHETSNQTLLESINSKSTFDSVFNSKEYIQAASNAIRNRNALAWKICKKMDLLYQTAPNEKIDGISFESCTPFINTSFNMIIEKAESESFYLFYQNCFNTMFDTSARKNGLLFGISRNNGYIWLNHNVKKFENNYYNAIPLGNVRKIGNERLLLLEGIELKNQFGTNSPRIAWGGLMNHNLKSFNESYDLECLTKVTIDKMLRKVYNYSDDSKSRPLTMIATYISSDDSMEKKIPEILKMRDKKLNYVYIPVKTEEGKIVINMIHEKAIKNSQNNFKKYLLDEIENEDGHFYKIAICLFEDK